MKYSNAQFVSPPKSWYLHYVFTLICVVKQNVVCENYKTRLQQRFFYRMLICKYYTTIYLLYLPNVNVTFVSLLVRTWHSRKHRWRIATACIVESCKFLLLLLLLRGLVQYGQCNSWRDVAGLYFKFNWSLIILLSIDANNFIKPWQIRQIFMSIISEKYFKFSKK